MNWLAHIYFSDESDEKQLGNFLGDFISRTPWQTCYNNAIKKGILDHFKLDKLATYHPAFQQSCERISKQNALYSMILIDVFYDHFLAKYWNEFSNMELETYVHSFYNVLKYYKHKVALPEKLLKIMPAMISENWLVSYSEYDGIQAALNRLSKRIHMPNTIDECLEELDRNFTGLEMDFRKCFSDMRKEFHRYDKKEQSLVFA